MVQWKSGKDQKRHLLKFVFHLISSMAGANSQKQLLTLIQDFANERSQGDRRVSDLKKRLSELRPELDAANGEVESAKHAKEMIEQELRGSEVELELNQAFIQAQENRISSLQEEISKIGSDLAHLKKEEGVSRDDFISKMFEFNQEIRNFQEKTADFFRHGRHGKISPNADKKIEDPQGMLLKQDTLKGVEDKLAVRGGQSQVKEQENHEEQIALIEVLKEVADLENRVFLMETIAKETKELQDLARYPSRESNRIWTSAYGSIASTS